MPASSQSPDNQFNQLNIYLCLYSHGIYINVVPTIMYEWTIKIHFFSYVAKQISSSYL